MLPGGHRYRSPCWCGRCSHPARGAWIESEQGAVRLAAVVAMAVVVAVATVMAITSRNPRRRSARTPRQAKSHRNPGKRNQARRASRTRLETRTRSSSRPPEPQSRCSCRSPGRRRRTPSRCLAWGGRPDSTPRQSLGKRPRRSQCCSGARGTLATAMPGLRSRGPAGGRGAQARGRATARHAGRRHAAVSSFVWLRSYERFATGQGTNLRRDLRTRAREDE